MESRDDALLSFRLAALPLERAPEQGWTELRARLAAATAPRQRKPTPAWMALAASIAAVGVWAALWQPQVSAPPAQPVTPSAITQLVQRSQSLENEIRGLRANTPDVDEMRYAWESAVEGDLALVDARLANATEPSIPLWEKRVRLLEELKAATQTDTGSVLLQARLD